MPCSRYGKRNKPCQDSTLRTRRPTLVLSPTPPQTTATRASAHGEPAPLQGLEAAIEKEREEAWCGVYSEGYSNRPHTHSLNGSSFPGGARFAEARDREGVVLGCWPW
jgi:hypothetical protein